MGVPYTLEPYIELFHCTACFFLHFPLKKENKFTKPSLGGLAGYLTKNRLSV